MEFELTPASSGTVMTLWVISAVLVAAALMFVWIAWSASNSSVTISNGVLQLRVPMYGRAIPVSNLDLAHARIMSADEAAAVRDAVRTNGIGLPGYATGWFKLSSGARALLAVTRGRVLYVPTNEGYALLLSVAHPEVALQQLRSAAGG